MKRWYQFPLSLSEWWPLDAVSCQLQDHLLLSLQTRRSSKDMSKATVDAKEAAKVDSS
jgi:hypothetical protein